jgi:hypothetical protein
VRGSFRACGNNPGSQQQADARHGENHSRADGAHDAESHSWSCEGGLVTSTHAAATPLAPLPQSLGALRAAGVGSESAGFLLGDFLLEDLSYVDASIRRRQQVIAKSSVLLKCILLEDRCVDNGSVHHYMGAAIVGNVFCASLQRKTERGNRLSVGPYVIRSADLRSSFQGGQSAFELP